MIVRPAAAAFGCRSCQNTIYRAVLSSTPSLRSFYGHPTERAPSLARRAFSVSRQWRSDVSKETAESDSLMAEEELEPTASDKPAPGRPWFLDVDPPRHPPSNHKPTLPKAPKDAPPILEPLIKYVYEDMGLDELSLMDLRAVDPPPALGPNLIMLFGTARSERHLHVSAGRLVRWVKRNYKFESQADGLIGAGELRTKLRRLRKKAKLMGTNTAIVPGGDNGISTGWICVNFRADGAEVAESVSVDDAGRFAGFGTAHTGTTIVVQCLTEARRNELELETLWRGVLKRSLEREKRITGQNNGDPKQVDEEVASRMQLSTSHSALQWQAMQQASQRRYFSTSTRRLQLDNSETARLADAAEGTSGDAANTLPTPPDFDALRQQIGELQASGRPLSDEVLVNLISAVFQAAPSPEGTELQRLALVDGLLLTAQERGMTVLSTDMLVTLIESVVSSPAYGPDLQRAQKNFEYLLTELQSPLESDQVVRLMAAYASRHIWDRFWDAFRTPPRFRMARTPEQYVLAYGALAAAGDAKMCSEALRWVYPEMLREEPPILPVGQIYQTLKACILVADHPAEALLDKQPDPEATVAQNNKLINREFLIMLKEVEAIRAQVEGLEAQAMGREQE